jgi:hypothetical protein
MQCNKLSYDDKFWKKTFSVDIHPVVSGEYVYLVQNEIARGPGVSADETKPTVTYVPYSS